ncbi:aminoacyl-histidine dipeptidase [Simiduia agarivorans]|uniref:Cytosol non-specific dipeptidase n=1 Tax=Simiduia agarivorans (strain DSM 21679 / JCM 13881 / BCRC 17597 / SA1) TaxID=1117647 RepID=K4KGK1_SIMAS|nr:aminoacyl-histidine dipeptidase [Simiduia agarivorans]AFU98204.1 putative aminoacyl-histidine dipeptidase PepD [Simiduia agarivorans SA1 = DSM 21679]
MASPLATLDPQPLWRHFQMLCDTPRPSKHEAAVVAKIEAFAAAHQLTCERDTVGNVLIRKPATAGMEDRVGVVMQSHLDMVPQKNNDKQHDFLTDPITPVRDGDWIRADHTTLGADNGIGAAAMLAVLESRDIAHGPLEALFTIDEEAGMTGAKGLAANWIEGELLFNLDTEDEGELYVGCAGGVNVNAVFPPEWQPTGPNMAGYTLSVKGLLGGHSGLDIHLGRGNANQMAALFVARLQAAFPVQLHAFNGGSLRNAIPREATIGLALNAEQKAAVLALFTAFKNDMEARYRQTEPHLCIELEECGLPAQILSLQQSRQLIASIVSCPSYPTRMSDALPGVTETSNNLATVTLAQDAVRIKCLVRSLLDSARDDLGLALCNHFALAGASTHTDGEYPGWTPDPESALLQTMRTVYQQHYQQEPAIKVIHAGLECGILGAIYPNWDMISFGPTIRCAHSPDEKVHIGSVQAFWQCLIKGLSAVPCVNR